MKVSIIITCFNRQLFVGRAIRSALSQRFPKSEYEIIVVDDGSTDHSRDVIRDFGDQIVTVFHKTNKGLPSARNSGIRKARGRFVIHLDSDDYMHEDMIYIEVMHMEMNPGWGAVSCDYFVVDYDENHLLREDGLLKPIACGIMFRKENFIEVGLYNPKMFLCEEEELRRRYAERYKIGHVNLPLYRYVRHNGNLTNNHKEVRKYRAKLKARSPKGENLQGARKRG